MHEHIYSLFVTVERTVPELGIPKAWFECSCGETLESYEGLAIINAAQPLRAVDEAYCAANCIDDPEKVGWAFCPYCGKRLHH